MLVIAGGYDVRLPENVDHHLELVEKAKNLGISDRIIFLRSISNDERLLLLDNTKILLYTPENEHFGIVPVEAMYMKCIVIACNSGGPLESVADGKSGYLLSPNSEEWGKKILLILNSGEENIQKMKNNAVKRVNDMFTFDVFADQLRDILLGM